MDPLEQPATPERLRTLAAAAVLTPDQLELALARAGHLPSARAWARFADRLLLVAGAALLLAGIVFFFAYNWADLHRFAKFALLQAAIIAGGGYVLWRGLERRDAQVALFAACVLVGVLLGVFGQVYQTGADAYTLFLTWAALILVPVVLARNAPLWMLLIGLLFVALDRGWDQRIAGAYAWKDPARFALAAATVIAWELARRPGATWNRAPWYGRALLALAAFWGCSVVFSAIAGNWYLHSDNLAALLAPALALALSACAAYYYRRVEPDLPALSLLALCAVAILTVQLLQWIGWNSLFGLLLIGVLVLAQVAAATVLLLREARAMGVLR